MSSPSGPPSPAADGGGDDRPATVVKEMSITHRELFRILERAIGGAPDRVDGNRIFIGTGPRRLEIVLSDEGQRRIGFLTLPVTTVEMTFHGYPEADRQAELARLDRAFQRGGG